MDLRVSAPRSRVLFAALTCLALAGCNKREASPASSDAPVAPQAAAAPATEARAAGGAEPLAPVQAQRAMRITVETTVRVDRVDVAASALRALVERHHGFVASARATGGERSERASFDLRVPAPSVAAFRSQVGELGALVSDVETAEDVTEQRADIEARVRNARAQEKRLLDLLSDKTGSLTDVMAVEKQLAAVRETIERIEAQQRVLEGQIAMATVKVELVSAPLAAAPVGTGGRILASMGEGLQAAGTFLVGLAIAFFWAAPTMLIVAALGYVAFRVARFFVRRARVRRMAARVATQAVA